MIKVHKIQSQQEIFIETIEYCNQDVVTNTPHCHDFWEIGYFEKGKGVHNIDFVDFEIQDKMLYFLPKGIVHTMHRKKHSFGKVIQFQDAIIHKKNLNEKLFFIETQVQLNDEFFTLFKNIFCQIEFLFSKENKFDTTVDSLLVALLEFYVSISKKKSDVDSKILSFLSYVEKEYSAKLTVEKCCNSLLISYTQLYQESKQKLGKTPNTIIRERVILEAKRLLFYSEFSIKEIANQLDFEDSSYFSKYFKVTVGVSPNEFREQMRNKKS